jgi:hypothetical protein
VGVRRRVEDRFCEEGVRNVLDEDPEGDQFEFVVVGELMTLAAGRPARTAGA